VSQQQFQLPQGLPFSGSQQHFSLAPPSVIPPTNPHSVKVENHVPLSAGIPAALNLSQSGLSPATNSASLAAAAAALNNSTAAAAAAAALNNPAAAAAAAALQLGHLSQLRLQSEEMSGDKSDIRRARR
jgi:hypothetical protein